MNDFFVVWKITCLKPDPDTQKVEAKSFIVMDDDGDPELQCQICYTESNHLPPDKEHIVNDSERLKRWYHYKELIGRVTFEDLEKLASKDKHGWRE